MASRKTDFNTEDIMGSLLGMNGPEINKEEEAPSVPPPQPKEEKKEKPQISVHDVSAGDSKPNVTEIRTEEREYIPIDPIRIHRRDEKEMKVPVSFSLSRNMAEQLKQIAYVDRVSSSEIVSGLIEAFINAHQDELNEYRSLSERRKTVKPFFIDISLLYKELYKQINK